MYLVPNNIQKGRSSFALHGAARACLSDRIDVISFNAIGSQEASQLLPPHLSPTVHPCRKEYHLASRKFNLLVYTAVKPGTTTSLLGIHAAEHATIHAHVAAPHGGVLSVQASQKHAAAKGTGKRHL